MPRAKNAQKCPEGNTKPLGTIRTRLFAFTLFDHHTHPPNMVGPWRFLLMGREICPKTGRPHFQSFVYFLEKYTVKKAADILQDHFGWRPHTESCHHSIYENMGYCNKDKDVYVWGERPLQGQRSDLQNLRDQITAGKPVDDIAMEEPHLYHQYGRTLHKVEDITLRKRFRNWMTQGLWYYGETGAGKSHIAFKDFNPDTHYVWKNDHGWWDGYTGQETVILNDFRGEIPYNELLQMIDKWPYSVSRRGREPAPFLAKTVIITSSLPPDKIYHRRMEEDNIEQLLRRLKVTHVIKDWGQ